MSVKAILTVTFKRGDFWMLRAAIILALAARGFPAHAGDEYYAAPLKWVEGNGGGGSGPPPCAKTYSSMEECVGAIMDPTCSIFTLSTFNSPPEIGYSAQCTVPKFPDRPYNDNVFYSCAQPSPQVYTVHVGLCRRMYVCDNLHYPTKGNPKTGEFCLRHPPQSRAPARHHH